MENRKLCSSRNVDEHLKPRLEQRKEQILHLRTCWANPFTSALSFDVQAVQSADITQQNFTIDSTDVYPIEDRDLAAADDASVENGECDGIIMEDLFESEHNEDGIEPQTPADIRIIWQLPVSSHFCVFVFLDQFQPRTTFERIPSETAEISNHPPVLCAFMLHAPGLPQKTSRAISSLRQISKFSNLPPRVSMAAASMAVLHSYKSSFPLNILAVAPFCPHMTWSAYAAMPAMMLFGGTRRKQDTGSRMYGSSQYIDQHPKSTGSSLSCTFDLSKYIYLTVWPTSEVGSKI
jgi:hypothetical protein